MWKQSSITYHQTASLRKALKSSCWQYRESGMLPVIDPCDIRELHILALSVPKRGMNCPFVLYAWNILTVTLPQTRNRDVKARREYLAVSEIFFHLFNIRRCNLRLALEAWPLILFMWWKGERKKIFSCFPWKWCKGIRILCSWNFASVLWSGMRHFQ